MRKTGLTTAFLLSVLLLVSRLGAEQASLGGRVYEAGSGRGVASLIVRLAPPNTQGDRQIITYTDSEGRFKLANLSPGRYLLTVSQGATLLHREVVDIRGDVTKDIHLQRG